MHEIKNTTVGGFGDANEAVKVVQALQECSQFPGGVWKLDIMSPVAGHINIGVYLRSADGRQGRVPETGLTTSLRSRLDCPGKEIAWFGYESGEEVPGKFSTSVYLYWRSGKRAKRVGDRIKDVMGSEEVSVDEPLEDKIEAVAVIRRQKSSKFSDVDSFLKVGEAAAGG